MVDILIITFCWCIWDKQMTTLSCSKNCNLFRLAKVQKHLLTKISLLYTPTTSNFVLTNWLIMRVTPIICRVSNYVYSINALLKKCELLVSLIKWFFGSLLKQRLYTNHEKMMIFLSLITLCGQIKIFQWFSCKTNFISILYYISTWDKNIRGYCTIFCIKA